jgi:hypothetical protein
LSVCDDGLQLFDARRDALALLGNGAEFVERAAFWVFGSAVGKLWGLNY